MKEVKQNQQVHESITPTFVAPILKYIALAIIIILPFIGFYSGILYQKNKVVEPSLEESENGNQYIYQVMDVMPNKLEIYTDIQNRFSLKYPQGYGIDYSIYNNSYIVNSDKTRLFHMENDHSFHDTSYDPDKNEFNFYITVSLATESDKNRLTNAAGSYDIYKNNNIEGIIELTATRDVSDDNYKDLQVSTIHDGLLYQFQLLGKLIIGRPPQYLPPHENHQAIFHTILSTLEFHEITTGYYEDDLVSFSYPPEWEISRRNWHSNRWEEESQGFFTVTVMEHSPDSGDNIFIFNPNNKILEGKTYEETIELDAFHDTSYGGTRYVGYGDYSVDLSEKENIVVNGKTGVNYSYYQSPPNPLIGAIHFIYVPAENNRFHRIEYSGPDKTPLLKILNSVRFK